MKKMRFTGELAKPITMRTRSVTLLTDTPEGRAEVERHNNEEVRRVVEESLSKAHLLFEKFEVPADVPVQTKFVFLALFLAKQFVPGFRVKNLAISRGKGRTRQWDIIKYTELVADAELLKNEKSRSDSEVCRVLATSSRFRVRWGRYNARTLLNRLIEARQAKKNTLIALTEALVRENPERSVEITRALIESFSITANRT